MDKDNVKGKIVKLLAHEQSARKIGNVAEADSYATHAKTLMRRHKITKKSLTQPTRPPAIKGEWICSCGFSISLNIDAGALGATMAEAMLAPHRGSGHKLQAVT